MIMTECRQQLQALLEIPGSTRQAALRRSNDASALFTCDLPVWAPPEMILIIRQRLIHAGWQVWDNRGWWQFFFLPAPPERVPELQCSSEEGCILSLLRRHPEGTASPEEILALLKALDSPAAQRERYFRELHAAFACRLRLGQPLPGDLLPWLESQLAEARTKHSMF